MVFDTSKCCCCYNIFGYKWLLYARLKNGTYNGNTCGGRAGFGGRVGGRAAFTRFPLSKSKSLHPVFIKLGEYVSGHYGVSMYVVYIFISLIQYRPSSITSQIPRCSLELWLLIYSTHFTTTAL